MRRRRLALYWGTVLVLGLCALAASGARSEYARPWKREPLRIALEQLISWNLGADVTIGAVEGPLVPEIVLRGVRVDVRGERLADIDAFRARVDVWSLFREDDPLVELIEVRNAAIRLTREEGGQWNLPRRGHPPTRDPGGDETRSFLSGLRIGALRIRGGVVHVRDPSAELDVGLDLDADVRNLALPWAAPHDRATEGAIDLRLRPSAMQGERIDSGSLVFSLTAGWLREVDLAARGSFGSARIRGELDVSKSWRQPAGQLAIAGTALRVRNLPLGDLEARLTSPGGGIVRIESLALEGAVPIRVDAGSELRVRNGLTFERVGIRVQGHPVAVSGSIGLGAFRALRVRTEGFRADLLGKLLGSPIALGGLVDAEATLDGALPAPALSGSVDWRHPRVSEVAIERASATIESVSDTLVIRALAVRSERRILRSTLTLPYAGGLRRLDPAAILRSPVTLFELRGDDIELALFEPFLFRQLRDLGGRAQIELSLRGARPQPRIEGFADLSNGSVRVPLLHSTFGPIEGRIAFDGATIALDSLRIGAAGGEALARGRVLLDQLAPTSVDLELALRRFPLATSGVLRARVGGEVSVSGPVDASAVTGALALVDTRIRLPESEDPLLREIRVIARAAPDEPLTRIVEGPDRPGLFERASLDLRLEIPRGTWVRGRGANLDLEGELALRKRPLEAPRYSGEIEVARGTYTLQGRRFAIRRGSLLFDGGTDADPLIDIEARHRVSDVEIIAFLTGRARDPILRLESEPELPESEVLHYLVFGRPSDGDADADQQLGAVASALAAGVALSQVTPMLEDALPIDTLEILVPSDRSEGAISVGKYVHEDVYIRYGRTLSRNPVDEVSIELRLDEHWSLESQASSDENAGVDVIWSFDY